MKLKIACFIYVFILFFLLCLQAVTLSAKSLRQRPAVATSIGTIEEEGRLLSKIFFIKNTSFTLK